jgi:DNA-binding response OmpR family regulator
MASMSSRAHAMPHTVLLVDPDSTARADTGQVLSVAGYLVTMVSSFEEAKQRLALAEPDLLIVDVRLGSYNGLHLVVRSHADFPKIVAIVTHVAHDHGVEADATALNAAYLVKPLNAEKLLRVVRDLLDERATRASTTVPRRWPRKRLTKAFIATIGWSHAKVLDLSYGGLRLRIAAVAEERLTSTQEVNIPRLGLSLQGRLVWVKRVGPAGLWWCGVALDEADPSTTHAWREFVDSVK